MRKTILLVLVACLFLAIIGCGADSAEPTEAAVEPAPQPAPIVEPETSFDPTAELPDQTEDPAGFWTARVDRMFLETDKDQDGLVSRVEFQGKADAFAEIDVNGDEAASKQELYDYVFKKWVRPPAQPTE